MLPFLWDQFGEGFLFQYAPMHKARVIKTQSDELGVVELDFDLNPIKHQQERILQAKTSCPTSVPDLTNALLDDWAKVLTDTLQNPFQKSGSYYSYYRTNAILMSMPLECIVIEFPVGVMVRCPNTFVQIVYIRYKLPILHLHMLYITLEANVCYIIHQKINQSRFGKFHSEKKC